MAPAIPGQTIVEPSPNRPATCAGRAAAKRRADEDGAQRPLSPALAPFLPLLGHELGEFARVPVVGSRGQIVGEVTVE